MNRRDPEMLTASLVSLFLGAYAGFVSHEYRELPVIIPVLLLVGSFCFAIAYISEG